MSQERPFNINLVIGGQQSGRSVNLAPHWLDDAAVESKEEGLHSRRREILFSCCFAESYFFEWVRDDVLRHDYAELVHFFPTGDRRGLRGRWKAVTKELFRRNHIPKQPDLGDAAWTEFVRVVDYRDWLVHAGASRPIRESQESDAEKDHHTFGNLPAGWAIGAVKEECIRLHNLSGTTLPNWLANR
jgi:hypothetical protein